MANFLLNKAMELGYISEGLMKKAEVYKRESGVSEETALRDMHLMTDDEILKMYSKIYPYPVAYEKEPEETNTARKFKRDELVRLGFFPERVGDDIRIVFSKPVDLLYAEDSIRSLLGYRGRYEYLLVSPYVLVSLVEAAFRDEGDDSDIHAEDMLSSDTQIYDIAEDDTSKVVSLVNKIFRNAIEERISDIHFEPQEDSFQVRLRKDGSLKTEYTYPLSVARQITNRIKTMSGLDVNNSKVIQNGNVRLNIYGDMVDLRISVIPAVHGENLVVRILDQNKMEFDVSCLGFSKENEQEFLKLIKKPQGIILLTGPTGSGKSTSLYAALSQLNTEDRCIITFEDPIEYRIPGIVQVEINPTMGVTFPEALKSGLRQDIEVALVGEIRDKETADIAFDAANTGHMVFSTLHTNSAASSVMRLVKMGIEPYLISRTLVAVINQRLAKRICPDCREEYILQSDSPFRKVLDCGDKEVKLYRGKGCRKCGGTGYRGRVAILEFLVIDEEIEKLLTKGADTAEIERAAQKKGMKTIQKDGIEKALAGITTLEEVHRTVFFDKL